MPSEILESSLDFIFYLIIGLIILSSMIPLQDFHVICEKVELKKFLETLVYVGKMLDEKMCITFLLEKPVSCEKIVFKADGHNVSIILDDRLYYSMVCDGIDFLREEVELHEKVTVSKIGGKVVVKSFE
ncbi:MAG: hypothetical protein H5T50_04500 [Nitrososphaeria archaeon]|nr:hypothetical protein [Nitrososphaeria archaeon]